MIKRFSFFVIIVITSGVILSLQIFFNNKIVRSKKVSLCYVKDLKLTRKPVLPRLIYFIPVSNVVGYRDEPEIAYAKLQKLKGKHLLVVYDSTDPNVNRLLLTESDFKKYQVPYPDSFLWLNQLLGE